jgi:predicted nucleic acid-binding protein
VAYLFDTDAISELLRKRPLPTYVAWLKSVPRDEQFSSAVVIGELYKGAFRAEHRERHLRNIEKRVLASVTVLPYDVATARVFGRVRAQLETQGRLLPDADLQIAATAIHHGLELVTGNVRPFRRIEGLKVDLHLHEARKASRA